MSDGTSRAPEGGAGVVEGHGATKQARTLGGCLPFIIGVLVLVLGLVGYLAFFNHFG